MFEQLLLSHERAISCLDMAQPQDPLTDAAIQVFVSNRLGRANVVGFGAEGGDRVRGKASSQQAEGGASFKRMIVHTTTSHHPWPAKYSIQVARWFCRNH